MTYATEQDLIDKYGQDELILLADRDGDQASDATVIAMALDAADREIEGYVIGRYSLPFDPVPDILTDIACTIARYHLHTAHRPETVEADYRHAMTRLKDIQAGRFVLAAAAAPTPAQSGAPKTAGGGATITLDSLKDF